MIQELHDGSDLSDAELSLAMEFCDGCVEVTFDDFETFFDAVSGPRTPLWFSCLPPVCSLACVLLVCLLAE